MGSWWGRADDGATVRVDGTDAHADLVEAVWPPMGLVRCADPGAPDVMVDVEQLGADEARVESALALFAAEHLVGRVAVHAGVVEWQGRALVLPGSSHAGKSTLCLALADRGAVVRSDEFAVLEPDGRVRGWNRPLHRRRPDGTVERVPLGSPVDQPVPVGLVADLRYAPEAGLQLAPMEPADVAQALLANTVSAQRDPDGAFGAAVTVARSAAGLSGTRGDARDAADRLLADAVWTA